MAHAHTHCYQTKTRARATPPYNTHDTHTRSHCQKSHLHIYTCVIPKTHSRAQFSHKKSLAPLQASAMSQLSLLFFSLQRRLPAVDDLEPAQVRGDLPRARLQRQPLQEQPALQRERAAAAAEAAAAAAGAGAGGCVRARRRVRAASVAQDRRVKEQVEGEWNRLLGLSCKGRWNFFCWVYFWSKILLDEVGVNFV